MPADPKRKRPTKDEPKRKPRLVPHPDDRDLFEGDALEPINVDGEAHVRALITGEGELWPERSS